jgi:hypothetical protein
VVGEGGGEELESKYETHFNLEFIEWGETLEKAGRALSKDLVFISI